jgi:DNA-binding PadR family transcriptional regulator
VSVSTLSGVELEILGFLSTGEKYGLEMVRASGGTLKRGTVNTTLQRMEDKGLVLSRQEDATPEQIGLPRRLYKPTALGERLASELHAMRGRLELALTGASS